MAIAQDLLTLILLVCFCLAFACLGSSILRLLQFRIVRDADHLLVAIGVGVVCVEVLLFFVQFTQHIRLGNLVVMSSLCIPLFSETVAIVRKFRPLLQDLRRQSVLCHYVVILIGIVLCVEFLTSMAPLSGSDALQYHFAVQKLILDQGFQPFFSDSHSFLCGQHHLLILLGLGLGSEKLSLGFILLGGLLSSAVLTSLASRWASDQVVAGITLLFLLTPVVFWQMCTSGSPDIFIVFFAGAVLIVLYERGDARTWREALVAGLLSGGIVGAKYTGCLIVMAVTAALIIEFRNMSTTAVFALGNLIGGIWPYLRNTLWTGNPVFPFLSETLSPKLITIYAMANLRSITGGATKHQLSQLFPFVLFAAMNPKSPGFWDFFGPTVLALAPFVLPAYRNTREWRLPLLIWLLSALSIFFASGLPRFLLPLFPIALFCVAGGMEYSLQRRWRIASTVSIGTMAFTIFVGAVGLAIYCKRPVLAAVGFIRRDAYLNENSQDYQAVQAVNQMLANDAKVGRTLVFLRHQYYLEVPYLNGDPATSFEVDPERLKTLEDWKRFLKAKGVTYVVRAPDYPVVIASPLNELERQGDLVIFGQRKVENLQGMRIQEVRAAINVTILKVNF